MTRLTVARLAKRDGAHCVHCGTTEGLTVQHRIRRGMGGSKAAERLSNGIILCWAYNVLIEQNAAQAAVANWRGWRLKTWQSTEVEPVYDYGSDTWFRVFDDGTRLESVAPVPF